MEHAKERHEEWVVKHAQEEFTPIDLAALAALFRFEGELDESYDLLAKISNLPNSVERRIEPTSEQFDAISDKIRIAVDSAAERGAPFAYELWYGIWRKIRQDRSIVEYSEWTREWDKP